MELLEEGELDSCHGSQVDGVIRVSVKDVIAVDGTTMRAGSGAIERPSTGDAAVVALLRAAGARIVGTTQTHELAFGATGLSSGAGGLRNPFDQRRIPGGSSAGAAVSVQREQCDLALGTDTGGSARIPAALCGVVGFKPTFGRVSTAGVLPLAPTLDHVALLGKEVDVIGRGFASLIGSQAEETEAPLGALRIAVLTESLETAETAVSTAFQDTLAELRSAGARVHSIQGFPQADVMQASSTILLFEASRIHRELHDRYGDQLGADVRDRLAAGLHISSHMYGNALRMQLAIRRRAHEVYREFDAVVSPTVPITAPLVSDVAAHGMTASLVFNTRLHNLTGAPTISLPAPASPLPVGFQLSTEWSRDLRCLAIARRVEHLLARH